MRKLHIMKKIIGMILVIMLIIVIGSVLKNKLSKNTEPLPRNDLQDEDSYSKTEEVDGLDANKNYE